MPNGRDDAEGAIAAFLSGRLGYDALVKALKTHAAGGLENGETVENLLLDTMMVGRLPADLVTILLNAVGRPPAATIDPGEGDTGAPGDGIVAEDDFEEATIPHAVMSPPAASGGPGATRRVPPQPAPAAEMGADYGPAQAGPLPPMPPQPRPVGSGGASAADEIRERVDDVVLSALVGEFGGYRRLNSGDGSRPEAGGRSGALDGLLSTYRSARFRADARHALRDGASDGMNLRKLDTFERARASVGSILRDRFILDFEIGRGGMGIVYATVDRRRLEAGSAQPYVALKLLNDEFRNNSDALRALESEARKAQSLAHPNIATVYDFDRDGAEIFIVMELLTGKPLARHLVDSLGQAMPGYRAAQMLKGICDGLAYAHGRGVVHSDLKPSNIFVMEDYTVKLLDFGLASATAGGGFDAAGLNALTAPYASPEMFAGAARDPRDDIFALGCIAYQLLMGTHPFGMKPSDEAARQGLTAEPIPDLDPAAWVAIEAALSFDRAARTGSVEEFFNAIFES